MTTENPEVDSPSLEGASDNQSPVSQGQGKSIEGKQQSSQEVLELKKLIEQQGKELRGLQSRQDKEKTETQRFLDEIKNHVKNGKSIDEAEKLVYADREVAEDKALIRKIAQHLNIDNSLQNVTGNNNNAVDDVAKVFKEYGVDMNDPAVAPFLTLKGEALEAKVAGYAFKKSQQTPRDSSEAGSISSNQVSGKMTESDAEVVYQKLGKLLLEPTKNKVQIAQAKKVLSDNGYKV